MPELRSLYELNIIHTTAILQVEVKRCNYFRQNFFFVIQYSIRNVISYSFLAHVFQVPFIVHGEMWFVRILNKRLKLLLKS